MEPAGHVAEVRYFSLFSAFAKAKCAKQGDCVSLRWMLCQGGILLVFTSLPLYRRCVFATAVKREKHDAAHRHTARLTPPAAARSSGPICLPVWRICKSRMRQTGRFGFPTLDAAPEWDGSGFHKSPDFPHLRILQLRKIGRSTMPIPGTPPPQTSAGSAIVLSLLNR